MIYKRSFVLVDEIMSAAEDFLFLFGRVNLGKK